MKKTKEKEARSARTSGRFRPIRCGSVATAVLAAMAAVLAAPSSAPAQTAITAILVSPDFDPEDPSSLMEFTEGASIVFTFQLVDVSTFTPAPVTQTETLSFNVTAFGPDGPLTTSGFLNASDLGAGTLTFSVGEHTKTFTLATSDDNAVDQPELVGILDLMHASFVPASLPVVCVLDNDGGSQTCPALPVLEPDPFVVKISVFPDLFLEGKGTDHPITFERTLPFDENPALTVSVRVEEMPRGLVESGDLGERTVTFSGPAPEFMFGQHIAELSIRAVDDEVHVPDGRVTVTILPGEDYTVGEPGSVTLRYLDDDGDAPPDGGGGDGDGNGDGNGDGDGDGDGNGNGDGDGGDGDGGDVRAIFSLAGAECGAELCVTQIGRRVVAEDRTEGNVAERRWSAGDGQTGTRRRFRPVWQAPGYYTLSLTVTTAGGTTGTRSRRVLVRPGDRDRKGECVPGAERHCFLDERYAVEIQVTSPEGETTRAKNAYEGTNDSGLFWFFDKANWEALVKVLDGCDVNGHHWVYGATTTDVGYVVKVTDTKSGAVKEYSNQPGTAAPALTDATAFSACEP